MNWYFALSATSFGSPSHDWPNLIRAAVSSALRVTSLVPHFLWDGPAHPFLDELRALGVKVIHHRVSFYDDLAAFKSDPGYLATAAGCFLRTEIPLLEDREPYVLYTDADVVFLSDPVPALSAMRPGLFAGAGEFTFVDGLNSGVLLLNVAGMRLDYPGFNRFIRENLALGLDQDMYRHYYAGRFETLAPVFNWKPYWGADHAAVILHWHGIKPVVARRLLNDPAARTVPELQLLVEQNPAGYRYYIDLFDSLLAQPAPTPRANTALATCAVVLVVRDEATDIAAWLAWYHVLGFDACIVYDDDSTDGTWEILQQASAGQDIRLQRSIGQKPGPYEHRQDECYRHAMREHGREFDWLAFFDADEFLLLNQDADIKTFLARFPDADAVAVNWCNYGSSFHILKPDQPIFEAFTWHGGLHQRINRHVKSIVRPNKVGAGWENVHYFDVPADRYVLSNGQRPVWSDTRGIIAGEPDWSVAKLMHYQCRSMEHFVERMKKRPALSGVRGIWHACDLRDAETRIPEQFGDAVKARMRRLGETQPAPAPRRGEIIFDIGMSAGDDTAFYLAKGFRVVGVEPDIETYLALCERFEAPLKTGRLVIHNCAACRSSGQIVTFHHHNKNQAISGLFNDRPEFAPGTYDSYPVMTIDWLALLEKHGAPYFVKIDIEGSEIAFLESIAATANRPAYISVECHQLAPVDMLHRLGYRHFKLVDQNPPGGFKMIEPQIEGHQVDWPHWHHDSSGPFGRDLPGEWVDFDEFKRQWHHVQPDYARTWFDCHARLLEGQLR